MSKELSQGLIRNTRIRECLAGRFGCSASEISITQAGRISIEGRGTVINNIDDFWSLLLGTSRIPRDPVFDETAPYCMNCEKWGDKWVKELCRQCLEPRNARNGTIHVSGPVSTCGLFKRRPDITPPAPEDTQGDQGESQDPPPKPKTSRKSKPKKKK
jgi:hypothetical protein